MGKQRKGTKKEIWSFRNYGFFLKTNGEFEEFFPVSSKIRKPSKGLLDSLLDRLAKEEGITFYDGSDLIRSINSKQIIYFSIPPYVPLHFQQTPRRNWLKFHLDKYSENPDQYPDSFGLSDFPDSIF